MSNGRRFRRHLAPLLTPAGVPIIDAPVNPGHSIQAGPHGLACSGCAWTHAGRHEVAQRAAWAHLKGEP